MTRCSKILLAICLTVALGCDAGQPVPAEGQGGLQVSTLLTDDVAGFQFDVAAGGAVVASRFVSTAANTSAFFSLAPGNYTVTATGDGRPRRPGCPMHAGQLAAPSFARVTRRHSRWSPAAGATAVAAWTSAAAPTASRRSPA